MEKWLYEDPKCEKRFMDTLKKSPGDLLWLMDEIFYDSSLDSNVIWLLFNYTFKRELKISDEKGNLINKPNIEVDIIGGKCQSLIINNSTLPKYIPLLNFITAIEVKCSRFDDREENDEKKLKAKQGDDEQEEIQKQLIDRLKMGFDKVSLLELIVSPPGHGKGMDAWFNACDNADITYDFMKNNNIFKNRLSHESQGHYIFKKGSVKKDEVNELSVGTGKPVVINKSKLNPFLSDKEAIYNSKIIKEALNREISKVYFHHVQ